MNRCSLIFFLTVTCHLLILKDNKNNKSQIDSSLPRKKTLSSFLSNEEWKNPRNLISVSPKKEKKLASLPSKVNNSLKNRRLDPKTQAPEIKTESDQKVSEKPQNESPKQKEATVSPTIDKNTNLYTYPYIPFVQDGPFFHPPLEITLNKNENPNSRTDILPDQLELNLAKQRNLTLKKLIGDFEDLYKNEIDPMAKKLEIKSAMQLEKMKQFVIERSKKI